MGAAEERNRRGGRERRYRTVRGTPLSDQGDDGALLAQALASTLRERAARRAPRGPGVTVDGELWVAPQVWQEVRRRLVELAEELHRAAQPPHAADTVALGVTVMAFPLLDARPLPKP
ncbi:hypothetical protein [Cryptosporangium aurantiacum]|uniref:hypothetical protein n=1 Tax=Cryptosporangium aurantiacum TaxID=134849 RepID=UPI000932EF78|nr:hypothetical protein [Cryptosporangium aurantiacum]